MSVQVVCYSGRKADERPIRFRLEGRDYVVREVVDQWYGPEDIFFKIAGMTATSTSCDTRPRCLTGSGILSPSPSSSGVRVLSPAFWRTPITNEWGHLPLAEKNCPEAAGCRVSPRSRPRGLRWG